MELLTIPDMQGVRIVGFDLYYKDEQGQVVIVRDALVKMVSNELEVSSPQGPLSVPQIVAISNENLAQRDDGRLEYLYTEKSAFDGEMVPSLNDGDIEDYGHMLEQQAERAAILEQLHQQAVELARLKEDLAQKDAELAARANALEQLDNDDEQLALLNAQLQSAQERYARIQEELYNVSDNSRWVKGNEGVFRFNVQQALAQAADQQDSPLYNSSSSASTTDSAELSTPIAIALPRPEDATTDQGTESVSSGVELLDSAEAASSSESEQAITDAVGDESTIEDATADDLTSDDLTSDDATSDELTSDEATSDKATSDALTSDEATSDKATSDELTSDEATSDEATSDEATSDKATSDELTSDEATSDKATSDELTSDEATSDKAMSDELTSDELTSDELTSDELTSDELTSDELTSDELTSDELTSDELTSDEATSDELTSDELTSDDTTADDTTADDTTADDATEVEDGFVGSLIAKYNNTTLLKEVEPNLAAYSEIDDAPSEESFIPSEEELDDFSQMIAALYEQNSLSGADDPLMFEAGGLAEIGIEDFTITLDLPPLTQNTKGSLVESDIEEVAEELDSSTETLPSIRVLFGNTLLHSETESGEEEFMRSRITESVYRVMNSSLYQELAKEGFGGVGEHSIELMWGMDGELDHSFDLSFTLNTSLVEIALDDPVIFDEGVAMMEVEEPPASEIDMFMLRGDLSEDSDTGLSSTDGITNEKVLTFDGTGEPGATINVVVDGQAVSATDTVGEDGRWSATLDGPLEEGTYEYTVSETDADGNISYLEPDQVTVDTTAPEGSGVTLPFDLDSLISGALENEDGALIEIDLNGDDYGSATVENGTWSISGDALNTGDTVVVTVTDLAGNSKVEDEVTV